MTDIVTIRHPDFDNETHVFGDIVVVVDIDLGRADLSSPDEWEDWAESRQADVNRVETKAAQRCIIEAVINAADEFGHTPPAWCALERYQ